MQPRSAPPEDADCPDCKRPMIFIGILPRAPFQPMQSVFHCDSCRHAKLRNAREDI